MAVEQNPDSANTLKLLKSPNIEDFNKIRIRNDENSILRAILTGLNLSENYHIQLRKELANIIEESNYNNDILNKLNYQNLKQLAEDVRNPNTNLSFYTISPLCNKYNLVCKIYLEDSIYKGNKWLEIRNVNQNINQQEPIFLSCYQGEKPDLEGHFYLLVPKLSPLQVYEAAKKIKETLDKVKNTKSISTQANIMIWNCDSISNYTKRSFLLEQLYTNNIQLCLLQETMLKRSDKMYMKGYRIYRADNSERRKGVAILVSDELKSLNQITEKDDTNGRYIQLKITADDNSHEVFLLNNIYIEPDQENNREIIPESIWQSEHIAGDLNKMNTGFTIESNIYHIKNMGKRINKINLPKIISDHPMLIYQMNIPIPLKNNFEEITIFDKNKLTQNNEEIKKITLNINYIPILINPSKIIKRKIHTIKLTNENRKF